MRLHRQPINAYRYRLSLSLGRAVLVVTIVIVPPCLFQHLVRYKVLSGAVTLDYRTDKVLGDIGIIGQKLLRVFRQAVAAIAEGWVVLVRTDSRVESHAVDNRFRVKPFHLGVGVELVKVADAQREVGVRK